MSQFETWQVVDIIMYINLKRGEVYINSKVKDVTLKKDVFPRIPRKKWLLFLGLKKSHFQSGC